MYNAIEKLEQKITMLLADAGYTNNSGVDCSEVAAYLKNNLHIGRICTVRAFMRTAEQQGTFFCVQEKQGCSEPYIYHTVLWYVHNNTIYIIDGTADKPVRTLGQFSTMLGQLNIQHGDCPAFVFYNGCVDEIYPRPLSYFKQSRFYAF